MQNGLHKEQYICQGYLCGPPPMIDAAIKEFTAEGMSNNEIFFDKFLDSGSK